MLSNLTTEEKLNFMHECFYRTVKTFDNSSVKDLKWCKRYCTFMLDKVNRELELRALMENM